MLIVNSVGSVGLALSDGFMCNKTNSGLVNAMFTGQKVSFLNMLLLKGCVLSKSTEKIRNKTEMIGHSGRRYSVYSHCLKSSVS